MLDNPLFSLIRSVVTNGLLQFSDLTVVVARDYQPTQQGMTTGPAVYIHVIGDNRYGHPLKKDVWNEDNQQMEHTESVIMETTFQVNARILVNPADTTQVTASDLVNLVAQILQSDIAISTFREQNIGIYRITSVRQTYIQNDKDRNEISPSFDFTVTHDRSLQYVNNVVQTIEPGVYRV